MICSENAVTAVTAVTVSFGKLPTCCRGYGITSIGSVATDPLVREVPETPGGDGNG